MIAAIAAGAGTFQYLHDNRHWIVAADSIRWATICAGFLLIGVNFEILGHGWATYFHVPRTHPLILLYSVGQQTILAVVIGVTWQQLGENWTWFTPIALAGISAKLGAITIMFFADQRAGWRGQERRRGDRRMASEPLR